MVETETEAPEGLARSLAQKEREHEQQITFTSNTPPLNHMKYVSSAAVCGTDSAQRHSLLTLFLEIAFSSRQRKCSHH